MQFLSLNGRHAVVTGAASGIGFAIADLFAEAGATLTLLDLDHDKISVAADSIGKSREGRVNAIVCDVSEVISVGEAFSRINEPIDILVNCAGIAHVGTLASTSLEDFQRIFAVNVRGTFLCMRSALGSMLGKNKGVIVNLASIAATAGISDRFAYSMSKGAVLSMTLSVAKDYISRGIRCNCISPARIHTPFVDGFLSTHYPGREKEQYRSLIATQPLGRMGTPEEVAMLALYLCSDMGSFMTGLDIPLDGGFFNLR